MSDDYEKFSAPRADEEVHQALPAPVIFGTNPEDGLPMQVAPQNIDKPPPLSEDSLVCMEDKRSFVIRNSDGSIWLSFEPKEVSRLPNGEYFVEIDTLMARVNDAYPGGPWFAARRRNESVEVPPDFSSLGQLSVELSIPVRRNGSMTNVARVEPIRPACAHYLRMQTDLGADREARFMQRACMAQKTEEGEFYSVRDARIVACSIRSPRHLESERVLDAFDDGKIQAAREQERLGEFDVDAELAAEQKAGGLGVLGG